MENFKREALKGERPLRLQWIDYWVSVITKMHEDERSSISNGLEEQIKIYRDKMAFASTQLDMVVAGNEDLVAEVGRPAIPDVKSLVQDIIANLQKYLTPGSPELGTNGSEVNASANTLAPIEPIRISPDAPDADMSGDDDNRSVTVLPQPQERSGLTAEALQVRRARKCYQRYLHTPKESGLVSPSARAIALEAGLIRLLPERRGSSATIMYPMTCPQTRKAAHSVWYVPLIPHPITPSFEVALANRSPLMLSLQAGIRTIHSEEVDGSDYIFEYSAAGPGWFVIRCDGEHAKSGYMHQFDANPFAWGRAKKHFKYRAARDKCHDIDVIGAYSELEMLRKFGYRGNT